MTRQEHLDWAKSRALEYIDRGQSQEALTSMFSDLSKHDELKNHKGIEIGVMLMLFGNLRTPNDARHFIEGFH